MSSPGLSASLEDYLEAIFHIVEEKQAARAKDIARHLNVAASSVTGALQALAQRELVNYAPYDVITLTPKGERLGRQIVRRHEAVRDFLTKVLLIDETNADEAACRMEHSLPESVMERFVQFLSFVEHCPRAGQRWMKGFGYYCDGHGSRDQCERCVGECLDEIVADLDTEEPKARPLYLADLEAGQRARIVSVADSLEGRARLAQVGLKPEAEIVVQPVPPPGDPLVVKAGDYHVPVQRREAAHIRVALL